MSESQITKRQPALKTFVIRSIKSRTLVEAFSESGDYFLGINGPMNTDLGVYNVGMFDKLLWEKI